MTLVFCIVLLGCGKADDLKKANELYEAGDFAAAMELFKSAAEDENGEALFQIGRMYLFGQGVDVDYDMAWEYSEKAVKAGYPLAANTLGVMCQNALGRERDMEAAIKYYETAADAGSEKACANLGNFYMNGLFVEPDYDKAYDYLMKAYEGGVISVSLLPLPRS